MILLEARKTGPDLRAGMWNNELVFDMGDRNGSGCSSMLGSLLVIALLGSWIAAINDVVEDEGWFLYNMACSSEQELIEDFSANEYKPEAWTLRAVESAEARGYYTLAFILKQNRHMRGLGGCEEYIITSAEGDIGWEGSSFPGVSLSDKMKDYVTIALHWYAIIGLIGAIICGCASSGSSTSGNKQDVSIKRKLLSKYGR